MIGNIEERVKVLAEMGQVPLAAFTAKAHNITEYIEKLEEQLEGTEISAHIPTNARLMLPPLPLCRPTTENQNWPLLKSMKQIFDQKAFEVPADVMLAPESSYIDAEEAPEETENALGGGWEDGDLDVSGAAGDAWAGLDDLGLDGMDLVVEDAPMDKG